MIVKCPECDLQISDKALFCPHCGYPLQPLPKTSKYKSNKRRRLPNGFGQISEIKGRSLRKPFRAMVTVGKDEFGRPICKTLKPEAYFATYNEAYEALVEYNRNPYDLKPDITVEEVYDRWLPGYEKTLENPDSLHKLTGAWHYCDKVKKMKMTELKAYHVKECMEHGEYHYRGKIHRPTATVKNSIKTLFSKLFKYAIEYEIVDKNYAATFSLPKDVTKELTNAKNPHMSYTEREIELLWENINKVEGVDAILFQIYSGWRPSELCDLKVENINLKEHTMTGGMKTDAGKNRIVPIHDKIYELVCQRVRQANKYNCPTLFCFAENSTRKNFTPATYRWFEDSVARAIRVLNINENHRPHDGRKTFITLAKKYNVDEYAIKYMVGHKIKDITERVYTDREIDWLKEEIQKIK